MNLGRIVVSLLKGKVIAAIVVGAVLVGGGTAVMAATSTGQHFIQTLTPQAATLKSHLLSTNQGHKNDSSANGHKDDSSQQDGTSNHNNICPEFDNVQSLAGKLSLKTASLSDAIQAICALHNGTFKGVTPSGITVLSQRALGYDEIAQLLKYAEYLANQNKANGTGKLTSDNLRTYLAAALQSCGTTSLATCVEQNIPSFLHNSTGNSSGENSPNWGSNSGNTPSFDNKNGQGKPISIPALVH